MSEWQPIETAPKDHGKLMLVYDGREKRIYEARRYDDRHGCELRIISHYDDITRINRCTHWMPLPHPQEVK